MTTIETKQEASDNIHQNLIEGCKRMDQKAQFQIYKLYYKAMFNTSLRIVKDPVKAEDIMQESFLVAFEKIGTCSGNVSFGAWLKGIVQNRSTETAGENQRYNL
jgi:DNA-directed RNA polymerase specialized sigma24 family protein